MNSLNRLLNLLYEGFWSHTGCADGGGDHPLYSEWDPDPLPAAGAVSGSFNASASGNGVEVVQNLTSTFSPGRVTVDGFASASAEWYYQPPGAWGVYGGGGFSFNADFSSGTIGTVPKALVVTGQIDIVIDGDPDLYPDETFVDVTLSSVVGSVETLIWQERVDGTSGNISMPFSRVEWVEEATDFVLKVDGETGTMADQTHDGLQFRSAAFSLDARGTEAEPMDVWPARDPVSPNTKSLSVEVLPPPGVTGFELESLTLDGGILAVSARKRNKQGDFIVKFPAEELALPSHLELYELRITGIGMGDDPQDLFPCFGDFSIWVEKKGGKPSY